MMTLRFSEARGRGANDNITPITEFTEYLAVDFKAGFRLKLYKE